MCVLKIVISSDIVRKRKTKNKQTPNRRDLPAFCMALSLFLGEMLFEKLKILYTTPHSKFKTKKKSRHVI